eukprot:4607808-Karenia_brevis.AAC.1
MRQRLMEATQKFVIKKQTTIKFGLESTQENWVDAEADEVDLGCFDDSESTTSRSKVWEQWGGL